MKQRKMYLLPMLLITVVAITLSSIGSAAGPVQIDFWGGWTGPDRDVMKSFVDRFNSSNPNINVNLMTLQWTPLFSKFMMEERGGNPPHILAMHPFEIGQFASFKVLDPKQVKNIKLKKTDYPDAVWQGTVYQNVQYAVPLDYHMHGLFYNKELFQKAGISNPPSNKDELIKIGQKLTIDKNGKNASEAGFDPQNVVQYGLGMLTNHHAFYQWYALMAQQGEIPCNEKMKKATFNNEKAIKAWSFLQDLVFKYSIVPKGEKAPIDDFKAGKVAMLIDGAWQLPGLEQTGMKYGVAPYPQIFEKKAVWGAGTVLTFPVNRNSTPEKQKAAAAFVKWLCDNSGEWVKSGSIPSKLSTIDEVKKYAGREAFLTMSSYFVMLPSLPKATQVFSAVAPSPILTAAQDILLNNKPAAQVVPQQKKDMDAILATP